MSRKAARSQSLWLSGAAVALFLLFASAASAADPIWEVHLPPSGFAVSTVTLKAGVVYPMEISGTRQKDRLQGSDHFLSSQDAFFCFANNRAFNDFDGECPIPNPPKPVDVVAITARTAETTTQHPLGEYLVEGEPSRINPSWKHPAYNDAQNHLYKFGFRPKLSGKLTLSTGEQCAGPKCTGPGYDIKVFEPQEAPEVTCTGDACVTLSGVTKKVEVSRNESGWEPATNGMKLSAGDRIHTGFKASVTATFVDGSTAVVKPMSLVQIQEVARSSNGALRGRVWLRLGEVTAQVNRSTGAAADFNVKTPTSTASVRGTKFTVAYNGLTTLVAVTESSVLVTANNGQSIEIPAGRQAESTAKAVTAPVAIGAGEKRGGLTAGKALTLMSSKIASGLKRCKFDVVSNKVAAAPGGWNGSFVIVGAKQGIDDKPKGTARFGLKGSKLSGGNSLAKKIAGGCR